MSWDFPPPPPTSWMLHVNVAIARTCTSLSHSKLFLQNGYIHTNVDFFESEVHVLPQFIFYLV